MKQKKLIKKLNSLGFYFLRNGGNHDIYTNGKKNISVPRHREVKENLAKSIIKTASEN